MFLDLSGYHLTYDQEFTKGSPFTVSPDGIGTMFKTQFDWGGRYNPSNDEDEFYSDPAFGVNPFSLVNGTLVITAAPAAGGASSATWGRDYTSGLITTQQTFAQHGGYFEIRAKVAGGAGLWSAFWLQPVSLADYPEFDILEDPNLGRSGFYWLHSTAPTDSNGQFIHANVPLDKAYHTYGMEWNDLTVTFYFDHQAVVEYPTPPQMANQSMYLILNLAVGGAGSWSGQPNAATHFPAEYKIDYIRVFSSYAGDPAVKQQAISSPDGVDTKPSYLPPPIPTVTTGSGPHALTLAMAEDFYSRDAKFTVAIDGVQQGGIFSTVALNAKGETQNFIFNGSFTPGAHTLAVTFLNAWNAGASYLKRDLYLNGAALDGVAIGGIPRGELKGSVHTLSFNVP